MKTEYSQEITELLQSNFIPATPTTENAEPKTLSQIHQIITSVLPAKWVYEEDVYNVLQQQGFKTFMHTVEENTALFYFVSLNKN